MQPADRKVVLLTALSHGQAHLFILTLGGIAIPLQREFGLGNEEIGRFATVAGLFFGLGALPAGMLTDRIGARWMILTFLVGASLASILLSFARTPMEATVAFAALGAFGSLYHPSGLSLLTRTVKKRGKALGYHGMAGSIAIALTPIVVAAIADATGSWRWSYRLIVIPAVLIMPLVLFLRDEGSTDAGAQRREGAGTTGPILVTLFALLVILGFTYRGVLTFLPKLLQENVDVSEYAPPESWLGGLLGSGETGHDGHGEGEEAPEPIGIDDPHGHKASAGGVLAFVALICGVFGQWVGGTLSHRFRLESLTAVLSFLVAGALLAMGLLHDLPLLTSSVLFSFFYFTLQPVGNGLVASYTPPERRSLAFGVAFTLSFGVGAGGGWFTGWISDAYGGLSSGMLANALLLLVGGVAAISLLVFVRSRERAA